MAPPTPADLSEPIDRLLAPFALALGVPLPPPVSALLAEFGAFLLDENERMNLTACRSAEELVWRHLADGVQFAAEILRHGPAASRIVDIGSGGGLPGIPLAILLPESRVTLLESVRKKAAFLERARDRLALGRVEVLCARAEEIGRQRERRERYRFATARACASLAVACEYGLPLVEKGGYLLTPKGPSATEEIAAAKRAIGELGGRLAGSGEYSLPASDVKFTMIRVFKAKPTPPAFPRAAAAMAKRPL